jgi:hypothetical protein
MVTVHDAFIVWLRAQLDEDERVARAATSGPWWDRGPILIAPGHHTICGGPSKWRGFDGSLGGDSRPIARIAPVPDDEGNLGFLTNHDADAEFIAHWDPDRALRDVQRNRRVLSRHMPTKDNVADRLGLDAPDMCGQCAQTWPCSDVRYLAAIFADRPGYQEEEWGT